MLNIDITGYRKLRISINAYTSEYGGQRELITCKDIPLSDFNDYTPSTNVRYRQIGCMGFAGKNHAASLILDMDNTGAANITKLLRVQRYYQCDSTYYTFEYKIYGIK